MAQSRTPRVSAYFRESRRRDSEVEYIHDAIEQLRHYYTGFEAPDGYSLARRKIVRMPRGRIDRVKRLIAQIRRELTGTHVEVRVRTPEKKAALYRHTGERVEEGRKVFIVHVARPDITKVKVRASGVKIIKVKGRKRKRRTPATVEEEQDVGGVRMYQRYFMFADYTKRRPITMDGILALVDRMLPDMPAGRYVFVSSVYGLISTAMNRDDLINRIERDWMMYDRIKGDENLAGTLLGFALIATTPEGSRREYTERMSRRDQMAAAKKRGDEKRLKRLAKRRKQSRSEGS